MYIIYIQNAHMYYTNEHVYFARQLYISVMVYIITNLDLLVIKHARDNGSLLHIRSTLYQSTLPSHPPTREETAHCVADQITQHLTYISLFLRDYGVDDT